MAHDALELCRERSAARVAVAVSLGLRLGAGLALRANRAGHGTSERKRELARLGTI